MQEARGQGAAPEIDVPTVAEYQPVRLGPVLEGAVPASTAGGMAAADLPRRELWPRLVVGPESGATEHWPVYFRDLEWQKQEATDSQMMSEQLTGALEARGRGTYSAETVADTVVQPAKFALDLGTLPVKMIVQPPWTTEVTQ